MHLESSNKGERPISLLFLPLSGKEVKLLSKLYRRGKGKEI